MAPAHSDASPPTVTSEKLSLTTKLAYGAGDLGTAITTNIAGTFLLFFFTSVAGLDPRLAGSILMISKIWDASIDPVIGILSDRTQSRWGRRLPWMIYAAIPFGISYFLLWLVPPLDKLGLFWYYVAISIAFNTLFTMVNLPYTALTAELTQDYNERTSLNSFRFSFSIGGSIVSLFIAILIFEFFKKSSGQLANNNFNSGTPYLVLGIIYGIIAILSICWCVFGTKRQVLVKESQRLTNQQAQADVSHTIPFLEQIRIAFSNRPFLYVIGIYFCSWLALQITASIIPYFVVHWMKLTQSDFIEVTLWVQGTALPMLFVWGAISKRVGKRAVYFMGMGLWIIAQVGLVMLQPNEVGLMKVLAFVAGCGVSTAYLIPWSMLPDVVDLDELETGQRREGVFYAFMVLLQKMGLAVGLFMLGQTLAWSGFKETVANQPAPIQPDSALLAIRIAIGPIPTVFLLIGLVLAYLYPITKEKHAEILLKIAERRNQDSDR
ncbi:MFS transporter [Tumidithrix elongata RA019]|uniref:MFS transporter n=1 Tax=Tumidithrix elongata BACA0141 TaxID=2716417 RepID=A0AAW9PVL1_9CYAN|nr:MFS transporter [Tumidithrix elongata RA019]